MFPGRFSRPSPLSLSLSLPKPPPGGTERPWKLPLLVTKTPRGAAEAKEAAAAPAANGLSLVELHTLVASNSRRQRPQQKLRAGLWKIIELAKGQCTCCRHYNGLFFVTRPFAFTLAAKQLQGHKCFMETVQTKPMAFF